MAPFFSYWRKYSESESEDRMKKMFLVTIFILMNTSMFSSLQASDERAFSRELLIKDTRQLAHILESAHPDPYIRGGGKVAFHRRLQQTLRAIPEQGMTREQYYMHLLPFVAAVGDGHTRIYFPGEETSSKPGLPLGFEVIGKKLYVAKVYFKKHEYLLGTTLEEIEGVSFAELLSRQGKLLGYDNIYHNLDHCIQSLKTKNSLQNLIPEWNSDKKGIQIILKSYDGTKKKHIFPAIKALPKNALTPASKIQIPQTDKTDIVYGFLDEKKNTAILRIDSMMTYREAFELWMNTGQESRKAFAGKVYNRFHETKPPDKLEDIVAGIPSATEVFKSMLIDMKKAKTENLIVDLRKNGGGNSIISGMLLYFLFGMQKAMSLNTGYQIKKYSPLYFQEYKKDNLENINKDREIHLTQEDYDFKDELEYQVIHDKKQDSLKKKLDEVKRFMQLIPTFANTVKTGRYQAYYRPEKIIVLTTAGTYSAGFDMAAALHESGAYIVGTPSAQAGNCFIDILGFKLDNTKISGYLSYEYNLQYPDDPEKGKVLQPHFLLDYEKLASFKFDPNAEILLALEAFSQMK
jgi:hypothetical protein